MLAVSDPLIDVSGLNAGHAVIEGQSIGPTAFAARMKRMEEMLAIEVIKRNLLFERQ